MSSLWSTLERPENCYLKDAKIGVRCVRSYSNVTLSYSSWHFSEAYTELGNKHSVEFVVCYSCSILFCTATALPILCLSLLSVNGRYIRFRLSLKTCRKKKLEMVNLMNFWWNFEKNEAIASSVSFYYDHIVTCSDIQVYLLEINILSDV